MYYEGDTGQNMLTLLIVPLAGACVSFLVSDTCAPFYTASENFTYIKFMMCAAVPFLPTEKLKNNNNKTVTIGFPSPQVLGATMLCMRGPSPSGFVL